MSDERLRTLERRWQESQDPADADALDAHLRRAGHPTPTPPFAHHAARAFLDLLCAAILDATDPDHLVLPCGHRAAEEPYHQGAGEGSTYTCPALCATDRAHPTIVSVIGLGPRPTRVLAAIAAASRDRGSWYSLATALGDTQLATALDTTRARAWVDGLVALPPREGVLADHTGPDFEHRWAEMRPHDALPSRTPPQTPPT